MCHCGNMGVEWTPNKSQQTELTLEKKILLPGFKLATFGSGVWRSYQQAIPAPSFVTFSELHVLGCLPGSITCIQPILHFRKL